MNLFYSCKNPLLVNDSKKESKKDKTVHFITYAPWHQMDNADV